MPMTVIVIDLVGLILVIIGFHLAFRQEFVRRLWAKWRAGDQSASPLVPLTDDDPARYVLRIAGVMIFAFGIVMSLLFTLAHYSVQSAL